MAERQKTLRTPYSGYHRYNGSPDLELTQVGPDTPGGEYLRSFWHPIELSSAVKNRPVALRIMGEDLVLFRNLGGELGLLHAHCTHRGANLAFGKITERGIQCCYHGWHYAPDGTLVETPVDPEAAVCGRVFQGAYPVREMCGLVFAYMGPPNDVPDFPMFDFFDELPVDGRILYKRHSPCNWIQVRDNEVDMAHVSFLHTVMSGVQVTPTQELLAHINAIESPTGLLTTQGRRVGENIFVRITSLTLPNLSRIACIDDGKSELMFDRRGPIVHWCVPVDDMNCFVIGWNTIAANLPDPKHNAFMDREVAAGRDPYTHPQLNFEIGQDGSRSYEERQRVPGDWDVWTSQGPISIHANEHLVPNDRGVVMFRRMLRAGIDAKRAGHDPRGLVRRVNGRIETYASSTSIRIPLAATPEEDRKLLIDVEREIVAKTLDGTYREGLRYKRVREHSPT